MSSPVWKPYFDCSTNSFWVIHEKCFEKNLLVTQKYYLYQNVWITIVIEMKNGKFEPVLIHQTIYSRVHIGLSWWVECIGDIKKFSRWSNLINIRSGIRAYGWEKIQKLINVRRTFIPDPRVLDLDLSVTKVLLQGGCTTWNSNR